jgi:putative ABC transport system permease protein
MGDAMLSDVGVALRALWRRPGFSFATVATLAVVIGANTAIFSVVRAVVLRPLDYPQPDRLVTLRETHPRLGERQVDSGSYLDWRDAAGSFTGLGAYGTSYPRAFAEPGEEPALIETQRLTPSVFGVLGAVPMLGRPFDEQAVDADGAQPILLGHGLWQRRFGGDPAIVGRRLKLDDDVFVVRGVMGPRFGFPSPRTEAWLPLVFDEEDRQSRKSHQWQVIGRLRDGVDVAAAQDEMAALAEGIAASHSEARDSSVVVAPFREALVRDTRPLLYTLFGAGGLVLLVACVNVANLQLLRLLAREHELALRVALGASYGRRLRLVFVEAALLAAAGGALGLVLARLGIDALLAGAPPDIPLLDATRLDAGVLLFAFLVTAGSLLLSGLLPALSRGRAAESVLRDNRAAGGRAQAGLRRLLVASELAFAMMLLVAAGLLTRSFARLHAEGPGFTSEGLVTLSLDLPGGRYDGSPQQQRFYDQLIARVAALPGVTAVAATPEPPVAGFRQTFSFVVEGKDPGPAGREDPVALRAVTPGLFRTIGLPLLRGRDFTPRERGPQPTVAIVDRRLAAMLWGDADPIGKRLSFDGAGGPWVEVVGLVADSRWSALDVAPEPALYVPYHQKRWEWMSWLTVVARVEGEDPAALGPALRQAVWSLDRELPIRGLATVEELYAGSAARRRFAMLLVGAFAALALLLGALGAYGVVAFSVAQRRRELGIRRALGAAPSALRRAVLGDGLAVAALGVAAGAAAAWSGSGLLAGLLYETPPRDATTFVVTAAVLFITVVAATALPARRAARIEPREALREE